MKVRLRKQQYYFLRESHIKFMRNVDITGDFRIDHASQLLQVGTSQRRQGIYVDTKFIDGAKSRVLII
jgi:hypothetical protein